MERNKHGAIAVIGIGCRLPGSAVNPETFWTLLSSGRDAWTEAPGDRFNWHSFSERSHHAHGLLNHRGGHFIKQEVTKFDAGFFGISPLEAKAMDPQQRLLLEVTYEALERAVLTLDAVKGSDTAVFAATFTNDYEHMLSKDFDDPTRYHFSGAGNATLANRISHTFDLRGPSVTIDTGCSGSGVAVHQACQSLRSFESSLAIAGGAVLMLSLDQAIVMSRQNFLNEEGRSFSFDSRGSGYGRGEGVAVLLLQRLDDSIRKGSPIRAVLRNSAVNQDGKTAGITFPSQAAQERLFDTLLTRSGLSPGDVQYIEAHGTGTIAGDQAEFNSIRNVYCRDRGMKHPLIVGCTKSNIGHLESASGVVGMIKTILCMEREQIPPNILYEAPKRAVRWNNELIRYPVTLQPWPPSAGPKRAVVNNFGYGGTNAAVLLESYFHSDFIVTTEAKEVERSTTANPRSAGHSSSSRWYILQISAMSRTSIQGFLDDLREWIKQNERKDLGALATTLAQRATYPWRLAVVAENVPSLVHVLHAISKLGPPRTCKPVFVFSGQGAQWPRMG